MAKILLLESATQRCSVALAEDGQVLSHCETLEPNAHSALLTVFIKELFEEFRISAGNLAAVAVSMGPGSYTGLRIGVSAAKGLCYGAEVPLIGILTLKAMTAGIMDENPGNIIYCPMIDARRMEVYTALYNSKLETLKLPEARIVDEHFLNDVEDGQQILVFGDGAEKCRKVLNNNSRIKFAEGFLNSAAHLCNPAFDALHNKAFENIALFEPFYLKEFVAGVPGVKGL